MCHGFISLW
jgi:hypothetical protein